jgi:prepilin-type N-terminal cleavage/methylation domain-containing protein
MQAGDAQKHGFTIIELLVVIAIIAAVMGIALPVLSNVRSKAKSILSMNNQKQIVTAVNIFATSNDESYPESVATVGYDTYWNWSDPTRLIGNKSRSPRIHRSMSEYLRGYITNANTMFCPDAPQKFKYLQQAWDAGDKWDNPDTTTSSDSLTGTYCFYWNYIGYLGGSKGTFFGPQNPSTGKMFSKLLITDYFGYNSWRSPGLYGSCESFEAAKIIPETWLLSAFWTGKGADKSAPQIKLRAGYTDGHVETYDSTDVVAMRVSLTSDGRTPYPDGVGPGIFYLPSKAVP